MPSFDLKKLDPGPVNQVMVMELALQFEVSGFDGLF